MQLQEKINIKQKTTTTPLKLNFFTMQVPSNILCLQMQIDSLENSSLTIIVQAIKSLEKFKQRGWWRWHI